MHELFVAQSIVEIACRIAERRRISQITVRVGHLRQVVPAALQFGFCLVAQGTAADGAELVLEPVPARGLCRTCAAETLLSGFPLQCGACGGFDLRVVAGEELIVDSLVVEETVDGDCSGEDSGS